MDIHKLSGKTTGCVRDISQEGHGVVIISSEEPSLDGRVAFIPGLIPGDLIEINEIRTKGKRLTVDQYTLRENSKLRQEPFCEHFSDCGGCQLQEMRYETTTDWKTKRVRDVLSRVAKIDDVERLVAPCLRLDEPYEYRSIVQLRVSPQGKLGFFAKGSNHVIELAHCPIQSAAMNKLRQTLNTLLQHVPASEVAKIKMTELRQNNDATKFMILFQFAEAIVEEDWDVFFDELINQIELKYGEGALSLWLEDDDYLLPLYGEKKLLIEEEKLKFLVSVNAFQQTNLKQNQALYDTVTDFAKTALKTTTNAKIIELYCGSGAMSLHLAKALPEARLLGIELVEDAVLDARDNAALNFIPDEQVKFRKGDARTFFAGEESDEDDPPPAEYDMIILDPPRQGLDKELCHAILDSGIKHILYVSCDPANLARDLTVLKEHYEVKRVQPIDMFPWTVHVETLVLLSKVAPTK